MLVLENVSKSYRKNHVINNCSFQIEASKIYGLIGENGSGKTTLLRLIAGILKQDTGTILFVGEPIFENEKIKKEIVFVSEDSFTVEKTTLKQLKAEYQLFYDNFNEMKYNRLIQLFQLDELAEITTFSKGMKRQALLVLGLSIDSKLFLIDETFDGLDLSLRYDLKQFLKTELSKNPNFSVIVSSHNIFELEHLCDELMVIEDNYLHVYNDIESFKNTVYHVDVVYHSNLIMDLECLYHSSNGKIQTFIIENDFEAIDCYFRSLDVIFYEIKPCTLEEIFVHIMKGIRRHE